MKREMSSFDLQKGGQDADSKRARLRNAASAFALMGSILRRLHQSNLHGEPQVDLSDELKIFLVEAYDNLDNVEQALVDLERHPGEAEVLHAIFRAIHSMKGNAGFLGFGSLETVCHRAEAILDRARKGRPLEPEATSALLSGVDCIRTILSSVEQTGSDAGVDIAPTLTSLNALLD